MPIDASVFDKIKTFQDYQQAEEAFQLKKQLVANQAAMLQSGVKLPAALQLANEYQKSVESGDLDRANAIAQFAKTQDKGVAIDAGGNYHSLPGYAPAIGAIEQGKQIGKDQADLAYKPAIAGGEANARNASDLNFKPQIESGVKTAETNAKRTNQAGNALGTIDEIELPDASGKSLLDKATGSYLGAVAAGAKGVIGKSDESTQANAKLEVLGNTLVSNVPRMEGPQSDADREYYKAQAGKIADKTIPVGDRKAALAEIKKLNLKYASPNAAPTAPRAVTKRLYSPSTGKTKLIYSDGTEDILNAQ